MCVSLLWKRNHLLSVAWLYENDAMNPEAKQVFQQEAFNFAIDAKCLNQFYQ